MKTVCPKHQVAYDTDQGCLDCTPSQGENSLSEFWAAWADAGVSKQDIKDFCTRILGVSEEDFDEDDHE